MNDPPSSMDSASEPLASTIFGGAPGTNRPREQVGALVGPYKLLQQLGEGGFGIVYMAEQEKPVPRVVVVKIIKPGMDTAQVMSFPTPYQVERLKYYAQHGSHTIFKG